jgi:PAS domain S-box-containing protein
MKNTIDLKVFESMPGMSLLLSPDAPQFTVLAVTDDYLQALGMPREALVDKPLFSIFPSTTGFMQGEDELLASLEWVVTERSAHSLGHHRYDLSLADGRTEERWWHISNRPVTDATGKLLSIIHTTADSTATVTSGHRQGQIQELERIRNFFMQAPVAICIVQGADYIVELANETMLQFLGRTPAIIGKPIEASLTEARQQGLIQILENVYQTGQPYAVSAFPASIMIDGKLQQRYFDLVFKPFQPVEHNRGVFCVAHNVTEQVKAQQQLQESEEELRLALEAADLGTFRLDLINNKATNSKRIDEWFGYDRQGYSREEGFDPIVPEDRQHVEAAIFATMKEEAHSRHDISYQIVHPVTGQKRHLRSFGKTFFNNAGKPYLIIGIIQDITIQVLQQMQMEENEAELQRRVLERTIELETLNNELKRSNINLEEFAYAASHDMKEPIRKIHFFADRLKTRLASNLQQEDKDYFERMERATKRMATLIDDLLLYSHVSRGIAERETVDLNAKLAIVLEDLELVIGDKKADIHADILPVVKGQRRQLQQLFQNLISNALKYTRPEVSPQIRISSQKIQGREVPDFPGRDESKHYFCISVSDNGIGFETEDAERIFNVFTRLHGNSEFKGTGVGLSIVRKVAENHQGTVIAEGIPGAGATFKIFLPVD